MSWVRIPLPTPTTKAPTSLIVIGLRTRIGKILRGVIVRHHSFYLRFLWAIGLLAGVALAQRQPPGQALYERNCARCHSAEGQAPPVTVLKMKSTESLFDSLM